ncbi:MAG: DUF1254 domain-containing protein [Pseudomonadota bacterium]
MRWAIGLVFLASAAIAAHFATLHLVPSVIMNRAQSVMAERGVPLYQWTASPRQTPQTQTVVRPSPDLSYAVCRFNTEDGPVLLSAPAWDDYGSLSVFDKQTNNVLVANLSGQSASVILYPYGQPPESDGRRYNGSNVRMIEVQGEGIALIRRLAPNQQKYDQAATLAADSQCAQIK